MKISFAIIFSFFFIVAGAKSFSDSKAWPRPSGWVNDFAGVLQPEESSSLEALLTELNRKTGAEVAVAVMPSLDGSDIESYGVDLAQSWGIGKKGKDNGALILVALQERKVRIEVGYGLEPILPDGKCGEIIHSGMIPYFKAGSYGQGILSGARSVAEVIAQDKGVTLSGVPSPENQMRGESRPSWSGMAIQLLFLILLAIVFIRHPFLFLFFMGMPGGRRSSFGGGFGGDGGGWGGFGGGSFGGGGASGSW